MRQFIHKKADAELPEICSRNPDWKKVMALIHEQRVIGHVWHGLKLQKKALPPEFVGFIRVAREKQKFRALVQIQALHKLAGELDRLDVKFLTMKGPVLSQMIFGDPTLRMSSDLDVLVPETAMDKIGQHLENIEYERTSPRKEASGREIKAHRAVGKDEVYWDPEHAVSVEIHWRAGKYSGGAEHLLGDSRGYSIVLGGRKFFTWPLAQNFRYLLEHGSRHQWARLGWLMDVLCLGKWRDMSMAGPDPFYQLMLRAEGGYFARQLLS